MEQIKNDHLAVEVSAHGAELQSIKDEQGHEYLWQGDADFWPRRSPILFPIVCGLWEGKYRTEGKEYEMERHGFARDMDFRLIRQTDTAVTYALESDATTLAQYPYHFILSVTYKLADNKIQVIWHVQNLDKREIHFSIGGHPAFNLPGISHPEPMRGVMEFDNKGTIERVIGNTGGCIEPERFAVDAKDGIWAFNEESFKDDAVIIDHCQLRSVSLLRPDGQPAVTVSFRAPAVGIWSPYGKNAPFVCIEPWYGIHDYAGYSGDLRDKYLINHLQPGASFMSQYTIEIG